MRKKDQFNVKLIVALILAIVGCALLIAGFIIPPAGAIDNSVLVAFGEVMTFVSAILGIDYTYKYNVNKNNLN